MVLYIMKLALAVIGVNLKQLKQNRVTGKLR